MGLDMYLEKSVFVGAQYDHLGVTGTVEIFAEGKKLDIDLKKISTVVEQVGYWRKANAIHAWFVENCQEGVDECQRTSVPFAKLVELYNIALKVKSNPQKYAQKLLPTQSGFFFGSTQYDEWYLQDINLTIDILKPIVEGKQDKGYYYYQSSW